MTMLEVDLDAEEHEAVQEERAYREPVRIGNPAVVARTTCRSGCGAIVEVRDAAQEAMAAFNRELARRGERRLELRDCVFCDACGKLFADARRAHGEKVSREVKEAILRLTDDPAPPGQEHTERNDLELVRRYCNEGGAVVDAILAKRRSGGNGGGRGRI
jgi:hypothetical protein